MTPPSAPAETPWIPWRTRGTMPVNQIPVGTVHLGAPHVSTPFAMHQRTSRSLLLLPASALALLASCGGGGGGGSTPAGPDVTYTSTTLTLHRGIQAAPLAPVVNSGTPDAWAVTAGALPAGLVLDAASGVITGTPSASQAATVATITASESGAGSGTVALTFTVDIPAPRALFALDQDNGRLASLLVDPAEGFVNHYDLEQGLDSPADLCLTPDLAYLYVVNFDSGTINGYAVDPATARLTELATSPETMIGGPVLNPSAVVTSPDGGFLYVADRLAAGVSSFSISADGDLTELAGSPSSGLTTARDLVALRRSGGDFLYVLAQGLTNEIVAFSIDGAGALTQIDTETGSTSPSRIAATPEGDFLYALNTGDDTVSGFSVGADGLLTELPGSPFNTLASSLSFPQGLSITSDGTDRRLYAGDNSGDIAQASIGGDGSLTLIGVDSRPGAQYQGLTGTPDGSQVFALDLGGDEVHTWSADGTGALDWHPSLGRVRMPGDYRAGVVLPSATTPVRTSDAVYAALNTGDVSQFALDGTLALTPFVPAEVNASTDVEALLVHPELDRVYVADQGSSSVISMPIQADLTLDGASNATAAAASTPLRLAMAPPGERLVLLSQGSPATLTSFPVGATGSLEVEGAPTSTGSIPLGVTIDPTGRNLYVANFGDDTVGNFDVDLATGAISAKATPTNLAGAGPRGVIVHPSGRYLYVTAGGSAGAGGDLIGQYLINPLDGSLFLMDPPSIGATTADPGPLACTPDGRYLLVGTQFSGTSALEVYQVNTDYTNLVNDGTLSGPLASAALPDVAQSIAVSGDGSTVYVGTSTSPTIQAFTLGSGGTLTPLDSETVGATLRQLDVRTRLE